MILVPSLQALYMQEEHHEKPEVPELSQFVTPATLVNTPCTLGYAWIVPGVYPVVPLPPHSPCFLYFSGQIISG